MIFQETWRQVLDGTKTQTRRLWTFGHWAGFADAECLELTAIVARQKMGEQIQYLYADGRLLWRVGNDYAVQPGRGKKAVGRIRITGIRLEKLQDITGSDAYHEGAGALLSRSVFSDMWDSIHRKRGERWQDSPLVWVLSFELVKEAGDE